MIYTLSRSSHCFVTGAEARVPERWDPQPSIAKLEDLGLVDLTELTPLAREASTFGIDLRMRLFPLYLDGTLVVATESLGEIDARTTYDPFDHCTPNAIIINSDGRRTPEAWEAHGSTTNLASTCGYIAPTSRPFTYHGLHEACHMLVQALRAVPGAMEEVERRVGIAIGIENYHFDDASPYAVLEIISQIGALGAGHLKSDARANHVSEQGAEGLSLAIEYGPHAPPVALAWRSVAEICFGATSPLARVINEVLHAEFALRRHESRTSPLRVQEVDRWGLPPRMLEAIHNDPYFAWEQMHPEARPATQIKIGRRTYELRGMAHTSDSAIPMPDDLMRAIHQAFQANPFTLTEVAGGDIYSGVRFARNGTKLRLLPPEPGAGSVTRPEHLQRRRLPESAFERRVANALHDAGRHSAGRSGRPGGRTRASSGQGLLD
jgi:hypothetical protein